LLIILISIPVQATITNEGVEKLIDIGTDVDPTYNPEGTKIVFAVSNFEDSSIWIFDLETRESYQINIPNTRHLMYTEWSPLGDKIVYREGAYFGLTHKIYTNNLLGTNPICLTNDQDFSTHGGSFSHDGSKIVYFSYLSKGVGDIWVMDVDGGNKIQLTNYQTVENEYNVLPSWSPDGSKIAFSSGVWPNAHIWVMNADGSNRIQLTDGSGFESYPAWSPDGRFIAYQKTDCADYCPWNVWVMKADGSEQTQLTNLAVDGIDGGSPDWHPNGNKLLFVSHGFDTGNLNLDIYEMTLGGINQPPVAYAGGSYIGDEGSTLTLDGSGSSDPDGNIVSYEWDLDNDGQYDAATGVTTDVIFEDNGVYTIGLKVTDENDEVDSDTATVTVNNVAPSVGPITAPIAPIDISNSIIPHATFSDPGTNDAPFICTINYGDGLGEQAGTINGNTCTGPAYTYPEAGVNTITLTVTDKDGASGESIYQYVVVYDLSAGFVTGGGFINSPVNACPVLCEGAEGKANFGFVSKYQKGANLPTGQTQFQFKAGNLNFHSSCYEWLVVAGSKAMFKGQGTINGAGEYKFMLSAIDADINTNDNIYVDRFRIKIWEEIMDENGVVISNIIYDNNYGNADDADPTTEIQGGSIKLHNGK